jgi:tetratricopeptide (TPR) repeat protein
MEINPSFAGAWEVKGMTDMRRKNPGEALESFGQALSRDPTLSSAYQSVAQIYDKWNKPQPTARHFEALSQQYPNVPWYAWMAADYYQGMDDVPKAMEKYEEFLAAVPHYADVHYKLALLYERGGEARAAMRHWNTYLALAAGTQYAPDAEAHRQALRRVVITSPDDDELVSGSVQIWGTALIDHFWYYKLELLDPETDEWRMIGDMQEQPAVDGLLGIWDTTGLPTGAYWLRLVVVDTTGNFVAPYALQVRIS